jgi:hypothetical protein
MAFVVAFDTDLFILGSVISNQMYCKLENMLQGLNHEAVM